MGCLVFCASFLFNIINIWSCMSLCLLCTFSLCTLFLLFDYYHYYKTFLTAGSFCDSLKCSLGWIVRVWSFPKGSQEPSHSFLFLKAQLGVEPSSRDQVGFRLVLETISRIVCSHHCFSQARIVCRIKHFRVRETSHVFQVKEMACPTGRTN